MAAGMSSRIGKLKPLLILGEKTVIEHMTDNASSEKINEVIVVVGKERERLIAKLTGKRIKIIENPDYKTSDMLASIKYGLQALDDDIDCFFIIPGDMPLISRACYEYMLKMFESSKESDIVQVSFQGKIGHPILIGKKYKKSILNYNGTKGMKGALEPYSSCSTVLNWHDKSVLMDIDTEYEYEQVKDFYRTKTIPSRSTVFEILKLNKVPTCIIRHLLAVEKIALLIAQKSVKKGYALNLDLVSAAALLHDVEKGKPNHASKGAEMLTRLGYEQVADIIREHMNISQDAIEHIDERAVVFLADKMIEGENIVSIEERFKDKLAFFQNKPEIYNNIKKIENNALYLQHLLLDEKS